MKTIHVPVLVREVVQLLSFEGDGWIVDGTIGSAGHAISLLEASPQAKLLGLDLDEDALKRSRERLHSYESRVVLEKSDYANMLVVMKKHGVAKAKSILLDLGWSSDQLADEERGFSFQTAGPLDMRYDRTSGTTLEKWLKNVEEEELAKALRKYGEERWASVIAHRLKRRLKEKPIRDTMELAEVITQSIPRKYHPRCVQPATKSFQAFRIVINQELERLERFLEIGGELLEVRGRLAIISFHSLEDRLVKRKFTQLASSCRCPPEFPVCRCGGLAPMRLLTRGAIRPSEEEVQVNPRARSAKLRAIERVI